jgi:hypothetical protein
VIFRVLCGLSFGELIFCYAVVSGMRRTPRELLVAVCAALMFSACATIRPPQPPSLKLPQPPTDLRARRKGDKVILTWTTPTYTTDREIIQSRGVTLICRAIETVLSQCGTPVGEAPPETNAAAANQHSRQKPLSSYSDSLPSQLEADDPSRYAMYAVEVLNAGRRGAGLSNQVRVLLTRTLPAPPDFNVHLTADGVVLNWTKADAPTHSAQLSYVYRVFRREDGGKSSVIGEVWDADKINLSLSDSSIEWEQTYYYHVEAVTMIAREDKTKTEIEGDDSAEVKVFTHDTFPPGVPSGLQAVFSGPGQQTFIDLIWAPVPDMDLAGYNVYRREDGAVTVKLNSELVKTPAYRDANVVSGKSYSYSVSAIDVRGNESSRSEEAAETVP